MGRPFGYVSAGVEQLRAAARVVSVLPRHPSRPDERHGDRRTQVARRDYRAADFGQDRPRHALLHL